MVSKSSKYNQRVKQLEATAAQLLEASEQVSVEAAEQVEFQLILADGVCQQMVLYDVMMPKHQPWLDVEPCTAQQQVPEKQITISQSSRVVQLVDNCNPMLRAMFYATPEQVRGAAALTRDGLAEIHRILFMELLVLLELMSPERYAAELAAKDAAAAAAGEDAAAGDAPAAAAGEACGVLPAVLDGLAGACSTEPGASTLGAETNSGAATAAAAEERLHELMQESMLLGGLVVIHNPNLMLEMCSINLATHETCVPPLGHFVRVAERLGLVQEQVLQMRLMLRQYNRSMQQQLQQGLRLLEVSQDSASLQVKAGAAAAQQPMHSGSGRSGGTGGQAAGGTSAGAATAAAAASNGGSTQQRGSSSCLGREGSAGGAGNGGLAAAPAASGGGGGGEASGGDPSNGSSRQQQQQDLEEGAGDELGMEGLFKELEQHLGDRLKVMQLMGFWVANTLSSRQMARFIVHSWPYYPQTPALAEAAGMLRPTAADKGGVQGRDAADTHAHVEWRRSGMRAELEWLVRHTPEFAGCGVGEGEGAGGLL